MANTLLAYRMLEQEACALLTRLARVKPFVLHETMVPAAAISRRAQAAIEPFLARGRRELRARVDTYIQWLKGAQVGGVGPNEANKRFTILRMRFNSVLTQFDVFSDALTQRSEHETGVWLAGLDVTAADALTLPDDYYSAPSLICYLDRGHGAAIRRARTRLPGGGENPVAMIRVPRERMVGSGIASSLVHEVGHQGSVLLDLVNSFRPTLQGLQRKGGAEKLVWNMWERWISEIIADFWSVAKLGIASTLGLIGVVSLPRPFVFRLSLDDPHPIPWLRVKLSCAMGKELYPHQQWDTLANLWESFYPKDGLDEEKLRILEMLETSLPSFVSLLVNHRPRTLRGKSLKEAMAVEERQPEHLAAFFQAWDASSAEMQKAPPTLAFAVIGQAKADGKMTPEQESTTIAGLLTRWALDRALEGPAPCKESSLARTWKMVPRVKVEENVFIATGG